ncbi:hypothetical protein NEIRO03_0164 [Nematocida sp. AWRm78]|nr:hypothetical protein NEIRO02_0022 [Nematocida sp. AWRm79]KAI5182480.1 hypothetical protein NEIRO03_0164 [Nematocida sp. AWRm78]
MMVSKQIMYTEDTRLLSIRVILMYGIGLLLVVFPLCLFPWIITQKEKIGPPKKPIIKEKPALPKHSNEDKEKCEVISVPRIEKYATKKEQHDRKDVPEEIDMNPIYLSKVLKYVLYLETNPDFISQEFSSSFIVEMDNIEYENMDDINSG